MDPRVDRIRWYLAEGHDGPRVEWLAAAAVLRVAETSPAGPNAFGSLVAIAELAPATAVVEELMIQDRGLGAALVEQSLGLLRTALADSLPDDLPSSVGVALSAVGLEGEPGYLRPQPHLATADPGAIDMALEVADRVLGLMGLVLEAPSGRRTSTYWPVYVDLYTGASGEDAETTAYELAAWAALVVARLHNAIRFTTRLPILIPESSRVPRMTAPGWYPNPTAHGPISDGSPAFQRYWDGGWTRRVRVRTASGWEEGELAFRQVPTDLLGDWRQAAKGLLGSPG